LTLQPLLRKELLYTLDRKLSKIYNHSGCGEEEFLSFSKYMKLNIFEELLSK
jgi:hypothetical protein